MTDAPAYIPPHLKGKISDFRKEDDGTFSFDHPEAYQGLSPDLSRIRLNAEQYKSTFDRDYRARNMADAVRDQYGLRRPQTGAQKINTGIGNALRGAYDWGTSSQAKSVGTAGLLSGIAGGGLGYLLSRRYGGGGGSISKALMFALLTGAAGAGVTAYAQGKHNRREAHLSKEASMEVSTALIRALENDISMSALDRARALQALAHVPSRERDDLYRSMRTTMGAGAGVLVMRFLGGKGLLPMVAGGMLGAMAGSMQFNNHRRNAMGQLSITNYL